MNAIDPIWTTEYINRDVPASMVVVNGSTKTSAIEMYFDGAKHDIEPSDNFTTGLYVGSPLVVVYKSGVNMTLSGTNPPTVDSTITDSGRSMKIMSVNGDFSVWFKDA